MQECSNYCLQWRRYWIQIQSPKREPGLRTLKVLEQGPRKGHQKGQELEHQRVLQWVLEPELQMQMVLRKKMQKRELEQEPQIPQR